MNLIERAILLCKTEEIGMTELPQVFHGTASSAADLFPGTKLNWAELFRKTLPEVQKIVWEEVERRYLEQALKKTHGRLDQTARIAGIHPRGLYNKMKHLGFRKEDYK